MKTLPLTVALAVSLACAAPALAQDMKNMKDPHAGMNMPAAKSPAGDEYMKSMAAMDDAMKKAPMTGDASKDFVIMMKPHHQAAVEMAQTYLKYGKDPMLTKMAKDIVSSQNKEIAAMDAWMKKNGGQ